MSSKEEAARIFVGGLSWDTTERHLESTFGRFGKVIDVQIMVERDTGRPRGFGFVTFADERAVEDAISDMHGRELDGRLISVNKAEPKVASDGPGYGYGGSAYSSGSRGYSGDRPPPVGRSECFKCGRPGHWARDCTAAGGGGGRFSSRSRYSPGSTGGVGGGGGGGRGDRFAGSDRYADRYAEDRYDGGRYGDRDRYDGGRYGDRDRTDSRDTRYSGGRDRYGGERYAPSDRYGGPDRTERYPQNGYSKERGYDRDGPARGGGGDRYGSGGPARYGGGGYKERPGPYDRPSRGGRGSSYDDRY